MNAPAPIPAGAKRLFTVEEFLAICATDVFKEGEHVELWDGEIVMAPSEGGPHFNVKAVLTGILARNCPEGLLVGPTGPLRMGERTLLEPDLFWFEPSGMELPTPERTKLVIEVASSSLSRDRREKALRYAQAGIADYWVIDADRLIAWVHRAPSASGYAEIREHGPQDAISPLAAPALRITLGELFPN